MNLFDKFKKFRGFSISKDGDSNKKEKPEIDDRKRFLKMFREIAGPILKEDGFKGSGQTFRRVNGSVAHLFCIQGSRYGGKCCVCLGIHLDFLPSYDGNVLDLTNIDEPSCEFRTRLNYGGLDTWWEYGMSESEAEQSIRKIIKTYLDVGKPYFNRFLKFPEHFTRVTPESFDSKTVEIYPPGWTDERALLSLSRIYLQVGNLDFSRKFAERGLSLLKNDHVSLRSQFNEVINASL